MVFARLAALPGDGAKLVTAVDIGDARPEPLGDLPAHERRQDLAACHDEPAAQAQPTARPHLGGRARDRPRQAQDDVRPQVAERLGQPRGLLPAIHRRLAKEAERGQCPGDGADRGRVLGRDEPDDRDPMPRPNPDPVERPPAKRGEQQLLGRRAAYREPLARGSARAADDEPLLIVARGDDLGSGPPLDRLARRDRDATDVGDRADVIGTQACRVEELAVVGDALVRMPDEPAQQPVPPGPRPGAARRDVVW